MAKKSIGIMIAILLFAFSIFAGSFEIGGGITYDQFSHVISADLGNDISGEFKTPYDALGFNINGTYWFTEKMGVEAGFDFSKGTINENEQTGETTNYTYFNSYKETSQLMGPSANFKYRVLQSPVALDLKVGGGYYFYSLSIEEKTEETGEQDYSYSDEISGSSFGMFIGADIVNPINDKLSMTANVGYKLFTNVSNLEDKDGNKIKDITLSLNGLKLGLGVAYSF
ncbi:MAG TPA: outer membrane beta-barrel protein [Defluviitaleaceae bacterium]|nr:outer membrane beta-barrel protein [Defluviitaleaceae bacterium]